MPSAPWCSVSILGVGRYANCIDFFQLLSFNLKQKSSVNLISIVRLHILVSENIVLMIKLNGTSPKRRCPFLVKIAELIQIFHFVSMLIHISLFYPKSLVPYVVHTFA